jgi:hypothetical protein
MLSDFTLTAFKQSIVISVNIPIISMQSINILSVIAPSVFMPNTYDLHYI